MPRTRVRPVKLDGCLTHENVVLQWAIRVRGHGDTAERPHERAHPKARNVAELVVRAERAHMLDAIERQLLQACAGVPRQWLPWRHAEPQRENRSIRHTDAGTRDRPGETALAWLSRATLRREILVEAAQLDQLVGGVRQLDQRVRRGRRVDDDVRIHQDGGRLVGARLCVGRNPYEEDRRCPHAATPMQSSKECHCPTSAGGSSIVSLPSGSAWCGGTVPVAENVGGQSDSRTVCCTSMNPCAVPLAGRIRVSTQLAPSASRWKIEFTSDRRRSAQHVIVVDAENVCSISLVTRNCNVRDDGA